MKRGSVFRKWDLHVHTPDSFVENYKFEGDADEYDNDIWEKYINKLEKIEGISAIGITDYFTIEGYKKVLKYRQQGRLTNFDLILPNVELRLSVLAKGKRLNYHVIFSETLDPNLIEEHFFRKLYFDTPKTGPRELSRKNIEEYGRTVKLQNAREYKGKSNFTVGCEITTIDLDNIIDTLKKNGDVFSGNYMLVLAEAGWEDLKWYSQEHGIKVKVLFPSDAMFSSDLKSRDWGLGKGYASQEAFIEEFGSLKPCISGSDAHCFKDLCLPPGEMFTWIKADTTFEGLRQIMFEPEDRVRLSSGCPEPSKNIYTLDSALIKEKNINRDLTMSQTYISMNSNLVTVIGGKGTGKTALLDLIANCFDDRCSTSGNTDSNSFVLRNEVEAPDLTIELSFADSSIPHFAKQLADNTKFEESRITYLAQGQIDAYSSRSDKLDEKILEIIFENSEIQSGDYKSKFYEIEAKTDKLAHEISEINIQISSLEQETQERIFQEIDGELHLRQGNLSNNAAKIKEVESKMGTGAKARISKLRENEKKVRHRHGELISLAGKLELLNIDIKDIDGRTNFAIKDVNALLKRIGIEEIIPRLMTDPHLKAIAAIETKMVKLKSVAESEIESIEAEIKSFSGIEKQHADLIEANKVIEKEINEYNQKMQGLKDKKAALTSKAQARNEKYIDFLHTYAEWKQLYKESIEVFAGGKSEILSSIDFEPHIDFAENEFISIGMDVMHNRKFQDDDMKKCLELLNLALQEHELDKQKKKVCEYIEKTLAFKARIKSSRNNLDFYNWIFGRYFTLSTKIYFNGKSLDKLSMGQKGTVLLKLFLAEGDYPLIIDQPEENLDNKFIFKELVGAFRQAKNKRQVIIATNNANLVVNTDAEQIIVAEYENNKITYKTGELEDLGIRDDITWILEGGKKAFEQRERKYAFRT